MFRPGKIVTWTPRLTQPTRPLSDRPQQPPPHGHNDPDGPVRNVYSENRLSSLDYFQRLQKLGKTTCPDYITDVRCVHKCTKKFKICSILHNI